jgi:hypothetical protein
MTLRSANKIIVREEPVVSLIKIVHRLPARIGDINSVKVYFVVGTELADVADVEVVQAVAA